MQIDTLRAAVGNADDVIKYLAVDDPWLDGAGQAKTRSSRWTRSLLMSSFGAAKIVPGAGAMVSAPAAHRQEDKKQILRSTQTGRRLGRNFA
jgi:hypothetical protein